MRDRDIAMNVRGSMETFRMTAAMSGTKNAANRNRNDGIFFITSEDVFGFGWRCFESRWRVAAMRVSDKIANQNLVTESSRFEFLASRPWSRKCWIIASPYVARNDAGYSFR